jgi:hypothetical protein
MSLKTLANKATEKVGKQMLTAKHHSPTALMAVGVVGFGATVYFACKASLQVGDILDKGQAKIEADAEHMNKSFEVSHDGTEKDKERFEAVLDKHTFRVKMHTAIEVAKAYAPATFFGIVTIAAFTGSHIILKRRNAAATAALAIAHKGFNDYRARVREELGDEKDLEFRFGVAEREIVEETETGPVVTTIKGLDQEAIKRAIEKGETYARIFDPENENWREGPHENQYFIKMVLGHARDALEIHGYLFLSDVYDMLGFKRTKASTQVGWIRDKGINPVTGKMNDGYVDFGLWAQGMHKGKEWINGNQDAFLLDFNVDGPIDHVLEVM